MSVYYACARCPRKPSQKLCNWSSRWFLAAMRVLGTKPGTYTGVTNGFKGWGIRPSPNFIFSFHFEVHSKRQFNLNFNANNYVNKPDTSGQSGKTNHPSRGSELLSALLSWGWRDYFIPLYWPILFKCDDFAEVVVDSFVSESCISLSTPFHFIATVLLSPFKVKIIGENCKLDSVKHCCGPVSLHEVVNGYSLLLLLREQMLRRLRLRDSQSSRLWRVDASGTLWKMHVAFPPTRYK